MFKIKFKAAVAGLVIFSILFSTNLATLAQTPPDPIVELPGSVSPDLGQPASPPPGTNAPTPQDPANLVIVLTPRNAAAFQALAEAVNDPASARFNQPLTDAEYRRDFAPDPQTVSDLKNYLAAQGLSLASESANGLVLSFKGTLAQRDKAFSTTTDYHASTDEKGLINITPLKLPASLAKNITGVLGFDQLHSAKSHAIGVKPGSTPSSGPSLNAVNQNSPASLRSIYSFPSNLNGSGTKVGIVLWTAPDLSNINRWKSDNGIPGTVNLIAVDPNTPIVPDSGDLEAHMDIQMVLSAAPNATVRYFVAQSSYYDTLAVALQTAVDDNVNALSSSWGGCETGISSTIRSAYNTIFQNAAAKGIPVFFSSGDSGVFECNNPNTVSAAGYSQFPAADPLVTSVGGTSLDHNSNNTWNNETAWSCSNQSDDTSCLQTRGGSSTGGKTVNYTRPAYQSSITPPAEAKFTNTAANTRLQPDISINGDPSSGEPIYTNGCTPGNANNNCYLGGGTSASSPFMAGIAALVAQKRGGSVAGWNNFVYSNFPNNWGFDVTSGYNGVTAKSGWDYTTGLGSIKNVTNFINAYVTAAAPFLTGSLAQVIELAGGGNGAIDPGETIGLKISLANTGPAPATGISATLSLTGGSATISGTSSTYPDLAAASLTAPVSAVNNTNFVFSTVYTQACGSTLSFRLTVTYNTNQTYLYDFTLRLGSAQTLNYSSNTAIAIPDDNASGINSVINVPNSFTVADVNVKLNITHTYDGDLVIKLVAPDSTSVTLASQAGGNGANFTNTVFDSQAVLGLDRGSAPFTGSFQPAQTLNTLNGKAANGTWTLNVSDIGAQDTGTLNNWSLTLQSGYTCAVYYPVPVLTSLSQNSATVGSNGFTLTVNGSNFINGVSVVRWNGSDRATTFISSGQLQAQILASDLLNVDTLSITVLNSPPGGGLSNSLPFTVNNPTPVISNVQVPPGTYAGADGFVLTVNGSGFVGSSTVTWNGSPVATTFVNNTKLTAQLTASDINHGGSYPVTVVNPAPGGGTSNSQNATLATTAPTATSTSPGAVPVNTAFVLTINGSYFVTSSTPTTVLWNGTSKTVTYINNHQLTIAVNSGDTGSTGAKTVTITNPGPAGGSTTIDVSVVANCAAAPLTVTQTGDGNTCGYLRYAVGQATANQTVALALPANQTITLNQALTVPARVSIAGTCTPSGPGITVNGGSTAASLTLSGANNLSGLKLLGFGGLNAPQLKALANGTAASKLTCARVSKT